MIFVAMFFVGISSHKKKLNHNVRKQHNSMDSSTLPYFTVKSGEEYDDSDTKMIFPLSEAEEESLKKKRVEKMKKVKEMIKNEVILLLFGELGINTETAKKAKAIHEIGESLDILIDNAKFELIRKRNKKTTVK